MTARPTETTNFFWHCLVAAKLIDEIPNKTAAKSHSLRAVRMATVCAAGKNGVQYASDDARKRREDIGKHWEQCGLVKEHVVPVSLIYALVHSKLTATCGTADTTTPHVLSDQVTQGLTPEVIALFQQHPRAWLVGRIVREWTLLAWITELENKRFDDKSLHGGISIRKRMPKGWTEEQDRFTRYADCDIALSRI